VTKENYLIIPDVHLPFEHPNALKFLKEIKKDFNIKDENCYSLGDLLDLYQFSSHQKSPDAKHTVNQEIEAAREKIRKWKSVFPQLKICQSNHEARLWKRAIEAELPSQIIRSIEEIFEYPKDWKIKSEWVIFGSKEEFVLQHGEGYSSPLAHREAAIHNGINTIIGHLHSNAGVSFIKTARQELWAMNAGCLVDNDAYAFEYGKHSKFKPTIGVGLVLDGGAFPLFVPLK